MDSQVTVKAVIRNQNGKYLIVREGERWQAVGGRLEKGERLVEGLKRETEEETGIDNLQVGETVHVDEWFSKPEGELKHIVAVFYSCDVDSDEIVLSSEHQEYAWALPAELDIYGDKLEPEIKKAIILDSKSR